jgi:hypothetical protein
VNVFASDPDPARAALALADRHVVKMALESAQIVWTALHLAAPSEVPPGGYRPTHQGHPCVRWAASSRAAYLWVADHGEALCAEYAHRYGRVHGSLAALLGARAAASLIPADPAPPIPQAMPEALRGPDPYAAYRRCLTAKYQAWGPAARWTRREPPDWLALSPCTP